jgi:hypothetical protein
LSLGSPVAAEPSSPALIGYLDVVLVILFCPIMLLIGVAPLGYGIGAGAWVVLRAAGVGVEHAAAASRDARTQITLRMAYMLGRLFLLALAIIMARRAGGQGAGLAALVLIAVAFTVQLAVSAVNRPRRR